MSPTPNPVASPADLGSLIAAARSGSPQALGELLQHCRSYLLLIANEEVAPDIQAKVAPSDMVQETFLEAHRDFHRFAGGTKAEVLAWLRSILKHNVANTCQGLRNTGKRQIDREVSLADSSGAKLLDQLTDPGEPPSRRLIEQEQDAALERAIDRLPEDYRNVIRWKKDEGCSWEQMAERLQRSPEAVRKLHARAVEHLGRLLESPHESR